MRALRLAALLVFVLAGLCPFDAAATSCASDDRACAAAAVREHPIRMRESWAEALKLPVEQRVGPAPAALVEYVTLDNIANGFAERPRALGAEFAGLYFVEALGGTGYTDYVSDGKRAVGAFIVLDAAVLSKRGANEWATWKESTPFSPDPAFGLQARIAAGAEDNRRNAIQYILLHELGHVMSVQANVHPPWNIAPRDVPAADGFPFFRLSWLVDRGANRYISLYDRDFTLREKVVYYQKAKLPARDIRDTYRQLEATSFPTLYAATHPGDDFAEAFANYVHVVLLKKPFEIALLENGRTVRTYRACWEERRCADKRRLLEKLLAAP